MSDYICKLNEAVERTHVRYPNRYGLMIAGDLYTAKELDRTKTHGAVIVGAPYGGVKEQGPCVYANELALRGFVVLTFDPCYMGESGGEPRHVYIHSFRFAQAQNVMKMVFLSLFFRYNSCS